MVNEYIVLVVGLFLACCIQFLGGIVGSYEPIFGIDSKDEVDLGNAICLEQYNSTFKDYEDGILECNKAELLKTYDGIKIKIK